MKRSRLFVVIVVVVILGVVALALTLRREMRCVGFSGPGVTASELPDGPVDDGLVRFAHFNLRNYPLDERPQIPDLGFSRRTNICDMEIVLGGLEADVMGFVEVCDTRRFPPILRRAGGDRPMRVLFSQGGGRAGQHLAITWNADRFELVDGPIEIATIAVTPDLRPGLAVRLRAVDQPEIDFTVVEVHLDSGRDDLDNRLDQIRFLTAWVAEWVEETGDPDVVVLGDFNTMGGEGLGPRDELYTVDSIVGEVGLGRVENATGCSQYWEGPGRPDGVFRSSLLDLVYVRGMDVAGPARSWLHCERRQCAELVSRAGEEDGTFFDVSDHCPVTFEVRTGEE
jgi:hypothetical protein